VDDWYLIQKGFYCDSLRFKQGLNLELRLFFNTEQEGVKGIVILKGKNGFVIEEANESVLVLRENARRWVGEVSECTAANLSRILGFPKIFLLSRLLDRGRVETTAGIHLKREIVCSRENKP
jgi:hypothetical protein